MIIKRLMPYTEMPPNRQDPVNYSPRADYLAAYIPPLASDIGQMADEFNATATDIEQLALQSLSAKSGAEIAAATAQGFANYEGVFQVGITNAIAGKSYGFNGRVWACLSNTNQAPSSSSQSWFGFIGIHDTYGLGAVEGIPFPGFNVQKKIGWYYATTVESIAGMPAGVTGNYAVIVDRENNYTLKQNTQQSIGRMFHGVSQSPTTAPTAWREIYHSGIIGQFDSNWTTVSSLQNNWSGTLRFIRRSGFVSIEIINVSALNASNIVIATLPSGYLPNNPIHSTCINSANYSTYMLQVNVNGTVAIQGAPSSASDIRGTITYPVI